MSTPPLAPRSSLGGVISVWVGAAVIAVCTGLFVGPDMRAQWLAVGLGACLLLAFGIQLWSGRSKGFTQRVAASVLGALVVMGVISLGFGLAAVIPA